MNKEIDLKTFQKEYLKFIYKLKSQGLKYHQINEILTTTMHLYIKKEAIKLIDEDYTQKQIWEKLGISESLLYKVMRIKTLDYNKKVRYY